MWSSSRSRFTSMAVALIAATVMPGHALTADQRGHAVPRVTRTGTAFRTAMTGTAMGMACQTALTPGRTTPVADKLAQSQTN